MKTFTKNQVRNLIKKLGYECHINHYSDNSVWYMVNPGIREITPYHERYFLDKGFIKKSDPVLGDWIEYKIK